MFLTDLPSFCNTAKKVPAENQDPYEQIIKLNGLYSSFLIPTASLRMSLEDSHLEVQAWCYSEVKDASMFSSWKTSEVAVCCMISATNRSYSPVSLT